MSYVDPNTVKLIGQIAETLPPDLQEELLLVAASWQQDLRNAPRWHFVEVLGFTSEGGTHQGRVRNISATGIFIETSSRFEKGDHIHMVMSFITEPEPVSLYGHVERQTSEGIGVKFDLSVIDSRFLEKTVLNHNKIIRGK